MSALPRRCFRPRSPSRESHGGEARIKAARFPARKTLEEFDYRLRDKDLGPAPAAVALLLLESIEVAGSTHAACRRRVLERYLNYGVKDCVWSRWSDRRGACASSPHTTSGLRRRALSVAARPGPVRTDPSLHPDASGAAHQLTSFQISGRRLASSAPTSLKIATARLRCAIACSSSPPAWCRSARLFSSAASRWRSP